eukprot:6150906-Pyramimonas_sp.AAC.1
MSLLAHSLNTASNNNTCTCSTRARDRASYIDGSYNIPAPVCCLITACIADRLAQFPAPSTPGTMQGYVPL